MTIEIIRTYHELIKIDNFEDRYRYLKLNGRVGEKTFGFDRILNQLLYSSKRWKRTRDNIIIRDKGCDLGMDGYDLHSEILVHHINPITLEDVEMEREEVFDPEYLICSSLNTHNAIHYGNESLLPRAPIIRRKNDTCPWR